MKGALLATAAAFAGTAVADIAHMRRHGHDSFHARRALQGDASETTCGCTTEVITITGQPTLVPVSTLTPTSTVTSEAVTTLSSTSTATLTVVMTPSSSSTPSPVPESTSTPSSTPEAAPTTASPTPAVVLPTPGVTSFSSTGTYTIPATTLTVTDSTTVCGAASTDLPSGSHTFGGVTTVVETSTTVTCPYATVKPSGSTSISTIETTTYVCPSGGTYTIAPTTTYVPSSTNVVYPTPHTVTPGTYTQSEQTVTVTRTDSTYVCPFDNIDKPTSTPAPATTTAVPATTTAAPSSTTSTPASSSSSTPAPSGVSGQMGMTYSPYSDDGGCKGESDIQKEVALIAKKGFSHVRVYSTDCNSLEYIGKAARQNNLKMIIGIFISSTGISGAQEQVTDITSWAQWDMVTLIVVGNEAIQNGYCDASSLASFIKSSKQAFEKAGYSGEVTTTEPINVWQQYGSSTLCSAVDVVGANIHPFFNAEISAEKAGEFATGEVKILENICGGKEVYNLETGWPSQGNANGLAIPSLANQATAIKELVKAVGTKSVFFSYSNDLWKDAGEFDVERYWGCADQFN